MMGDHHISVVSGRRGLGMTSALRAIIRAAAKETLALLHVDMPSEIAVRITDDREMADFNLLHRNREGTTDVLSFPMFDLRPGMPVPADPLAIDPLSGLLFLGDIVISIDRAKEQAEEYGHSLSRELGYLTVHSVLHLLGYDHETPGERAVMREQEENVLRSLGLARTGDSDTDGGLGPAGNGVH
ncbi:rRNA maturation RNase YbeY [Oscillospiraceae bacterium OttesenSCG-928-G22]|nr:rRNA maturation RNase YbeY [Oscillospiraceae bacterium OttesenSCG-928-G22]